MAELDPAMQAAMLRLDPVADREEYAALAEMLSGEGPLGSLPTREEQALIAGAVLGDLWRRRRERSPILIVIDEAHNVCPCESPRRGDRAARRPAMGPVLTGRYSPLSGCGPRMRDLSSGPHLGSREFAESWMHAQDSPGHGRCAPRCWRCSDGCVHGDRAL
jgi:hypothetical protein